MCRVLNIPRSLVYYKRKIRVCNTKLENAVISIFRESKNNYGTRKIKVELKKQDIIASRRKIRQIMKKYRLISNYTVKQYKVHKSKCNEEKIDNVVHREIVGYSACPNKNAKLVYEAFMNSTINLKKVKIFHTDRGNEFKNKIIDELLDTFEIERSLIKKGCHYDNAVAEAGYKIIKTEFAFDRIFESLEQLKLELRSYVLWYNNKRIHSALGYMTPVEYRISNMTE